MTDKGGGGRSTLNAPPRGFCCLRLMLNSAQIEQELVSIEEVVQVGALQ